MQSAETDSLKPARPLRVVTLERIGLPNDHMASAYAVECADVKAGMHVPSAAFVLLHADDMARACGCTFSRLRPWAWWRLIPGCSARFEPVVSLGHLPDLIADMDPAAAQNLTGCIATARFVVAEPKVSAVVYKDVPYSSPTISSASSASCAGRRTDGAEPGPHRTNAGAPSGDRPAKRARVERSAPSGDGCQPYDAAIAWFFAHEGSLSYDLRKDAILRLAWRLHGELCVQEELANTLAGVLRAVYEGDAFVASSVLPATHDPPPPESLADAAEYISLKLRCVRMGAMLSARRQQTTFLSSALASLPKARVVRGRGGTNAPAAVTPGGRDTTH